MEYFIQHTLISVIVHNCVFTRNQCISKLVQDKVERKILLELEGRS